MGEEMTRRAHRKKVEKSGWRWEKIGDRRGEERLEKRKQTNNVLQKECSTE